MKHEKTPRRILRGVTAVLVAAVVAGAAGTANAAPERRQTLSGTATGCATRVRLAPAAGEVQVLTGFDFRYLNGDHHIAQIAALPISDGRLFTCFHDKIIPDDPMAYNVGLSNVGLSGAITPPPLQENCGGGSCVYDLQPPPSDLYVFVIRGFKFVWRDVDDDKHLSDIGIQLSPGDDNKVTVTYADTSRNDDYSVELSYAWVPRSLVAGFNVQSGRVEDAGVVQRTGIQAGSKAISGFRIRYSVVNALPPYIPDHHILRFGYTLADTSVTAYFHDNDPDGSSWDFQLNHVRFR